jgi:hypothetical protein
MAELSPSSVKNGHKLAAELVERMQTAVTGTAIILLIERFGTLVRYLAKFIICLETNR